MGLIDREEAFVPRSRDRNFGGILFVAAVAVVLFAVIEAVFG